MPILLDPLKQFTLLWMTVHLIQSLLILLLPNIFAYFAEFSNVENYEPGSTLFSPMGQSWSIITRIDESISGYPRNHNMES